MVLALSIICLFLLYHLLKKETDNKKSNVDKHGQETIKLKSVPSDKNTLACEHDFITLFVFNTQARTSHVICSKCQSEGLYYRTSGVFEVKDKFFINNMYEDVSEYKKEEEF